MAKQDSINHKLILGVAVLLILAGFTYFFFTHRFQKSTNVEEKAPVAESAGKLATKYISTVDWPPKVQVQNEAFTCTQAGEEMSQAGKTEKKIINGRTYCVTKVSQGAAGSIYTQYAYAFPKDKEVVILTFSLRFVQCANYPQPSRGECEQERASFNIDRLIDQISQTLVIK